MYPFVLRSNPITEEAATAPLSIGDLARRTGVPQATLRTWESRHGVPRAHRLPGGHRRYDETAVTVVQEIVRRRATGLAMEAAVAGATTGAAAADPSVFAGLRRRHPGLATQLLAKPTLLALTRAMEDECCARAEHAVLFAAFQKSRFFDRAAHRWQEISRTSETTVVFADFSEPSAPGESPVRVPLPGNAPLRREWLLVCDSPGHPACVAGWERPDQDVTSDPDRLFETVWSVDPRVVRDAARICAGLADSFLPDRGLGLDQRLGTAPISASADLQRATGLFDRLLGYVDTRS